VTQWELRNWKKEDFEWWGQFGITKAKLEKYNVAPMGEFKMHKISDGEEKIMTFNNPRAYGYLTNTGALAKIYQPGMKGAKFIKVMEYYLQGSDQLTFSVDDLLIMSSLKDGMGFMELGFEGYEFVAPDSENVPITPKDMEWLMSKYKRVRIFFDNDPAGRKAAMQYKKLYGTETINLMMGKDLTDSIAQYNQMLVKIELTPLL
jgi:hypothetical protein